MIRPSVLLDHAMDQPFDGHHMTAANIRECQQWVEAATRVSRAPVLGPEDVAPTYRGQIRQLGMDNVVNLGRVRIEFSKPLGNEEDQGPTQVIIYNGKSRFSLVLDDPGEAQAILAVSSLARSKPTTTTPYVAFAVRSMRGPQVINMRTRDEDYVSQITFCHGGDAIPGGSPRGGVWGVWGFS